jgi:hypothetical protein
MKYGVLAITVSLVCGCAAVPRATPPKPALSVFVVAHPDDWQLFMNPAAFHAMNDPHGKAVFVHVSPVTPRPASRHLITSRAR